MRCAVVLLLGILMAAVPRTALAHAVLVSSTPQKDAAVSGPDITIHLKYNSRIDGGSFDLEPAEAGRNGAENR